MKQFYYALVSRRDASALLIAATVLALYANSVDNAFQYDDRHSIVENHHLRSLANIPAFFSHPEYFSRDPDKAMYRPLLLVSYALNYAWGQYGVRSYHFVNMALHLGCALLVWGLLRRLEQAPCMSLFGALFFAVHPLATEPVNYISSRSELLAALGVFSSLLLYLHAAERGSVGLYAASVICFAAGLLSKSVAMALPVWIVLWEGHKGGWSWRWASRLWPYALVACGYVLLVRGFLVKAVLAAPVRGWSEQLGTQAKALVYYVLLMFSPHKLSVHHAFSESGLGAPVVLVCVLSLGSLFLLLRGLGQLGVGLMLVALLPTLIVPLNVLVNEHRLYLPLFGLVVALLGLRRLEGWPALRVGAPVLLGLLALTAWERNRVWADEASLWGNAAKHNPTAVRPHVYMGNAARQQGDLQGAEGHFRHALKLQPDNPTARANLGNVYQDQGNHEKAIAEFDRILAEYPEMTDIYYSLGRALQAAGRGAEARARYRQVPASSPHLALALNNTGTLFEAEGRIDSALYYYEAARTSGLEQARDNWGRLRGESVQRIQTALEGGELLASEALARALVAADPADRDGQFLLAVGLYLQRRYSESIVENQRLLVHHPDDDEGQIQLALALETGGRLAEAQSTYETLIARTRSDQMRYLARERLQALIERMP